jgi:peroxiredoxin
MNYIQTKNEENGNTIKLAYKDYGQGQPVILIHGWPLSQHMWEYQVEKIVKAGFRCISYDRRGFGDSDQPWEGYDYDTLASDLNDVITALGLSNAVIVGFSMGGGEVARFIGKYGTANIEKAALISAVPPFMLKTDDNPKGLEKEVFEGFKQSIRKDRAGFLAGFGDKFYNFDKNKNRISEQQKHYDWSIACKASSKATLDCVDAFGLTDFRDDLKQFDVPTLIVHGDEDEIVPIDLAGGKSKDLVKDSTFEVIAGAPHGLVMTHKKEFNEVLLRFLKT